MSFPYRLAAIDLDGTLLGPDKKIGAANAAAVEELRRCGVHVVLASGRRHENMLSFHRQLGLRGPVLSCNGALVKDAETGEILHEHLVPADLAARVIADGTARGMTQNYYGADGVYVREKTRWTDLYQSRTGSDLVVYGDLTGLAESDGGPQKIIWVDTPERIAALFPDREARYRGRLYVTVTDPEYLEFMALGVSKAAGLAVVATHYGIGPAEVLAFGDGNNDIPMLEWAGLGVVMSNAPESIKAAAALVSPPGDPEASLARAVAAVWEHG